MGKNSAPPPPQPSAAEQSLMDKQGQAIDSYLASIEDQKKQDKSYGDIVAVSSGLYDPVYDDNGNLVDTKLNQGALDAQRALVASQTKIGQESADRYEKALNGTLPVSEALTQQKAKDFQLFKEAQSRAGNIITGESPETASASSTAGITSLDAFQKQYKLLEDQERQGALAPPGTFVGTSPTLGLYGQSVASGPGAQASGYGSIASLYGQAQQPYQFQRNLDYTTSNQNAINGAATRAGYAGLVGQAAGTAIGLSLPTPKKA